MPADSKESARDGNRGRSVRNFRLSALGLLLGAVPLVLAWGTGDFGRPPDGVTGIALNGRWISDWLVPVCVAAVLAYGTTRVGVDHRLAAAGRTDLRTLWWSTQMIPLTSVFCGTLSLSYSMSVWTGEPTLTILVPTLLGVVLACCVAAVVVTRWGHGPTVSMGVAAPFTAAVLILPYRVPGLELLAVDGTLARWMIDGQPGQAEISTVGGGACALLSGALVLLNRYLPQDISGLAWIGKEVIDVD